MSTKALAEKIEEARSELKQFKQIKSEIEHDNPDNEKAIAAIDKAIAQTERDLNILLKTPSEADL